MICYRCGDSGHYRPSCEKTKDATCYACGGKRHFAKMRKSKDKKLHILLDNYSEEIFVVAGKNDATLELHVSLESKPVKFLIDSRASINVIDNDLYEQVKSKENRLSLRKMTLLRKYLDQLHGYPMS